MIRPAAALALWIVAAPALAALESVRVAPPVEVQQGARRESLLPRKPLTAGDTIVTGAQGRATVQLDAASLITLGAASELYVHSVVEPPAAVLRLALVRGAALIDGRPSDGPLPQDIRLNAGRMRVRIYGAQAWASLEDIGETVCLLSGAVEMQIVGIGPARLDQPGDCYFVNRRGQRSLITPDTDTLMRKLARTDYTLTEPGRWTVVIGSFTDAESAQAEAMGLRERGVQAAVRTFRDGVRNRYRLTVGQYDNRRAAEAAAAEARQLLSVTSAWVTEY